MFALKNSSRVQKRLFNARSSEGTKIIEETLVDSSARLEDAKIHENPIDRQERSKWAGTLKALIIISLLPSVGQVPRSLLNIHLKNVAPRGPRPRPRLWLRCSHEAKP